MAPSWPTFRIPVRTPKGLMVLNLILDFQGIRKLFVKVERDTLYSNQQSRGLIIDRLLDMCYMGLHLYPWPWGSLQVLEAHQELRGNVTFAISVSGPF